MTALSAIAHQIWDMKYRFKEADGTVHDRTVEESWRRIAKSLAETEQDPSHYEAQFYKALEGFRFLPAGRIVAGAGTARSVTLFNCFVMGTIPDSMAGIFDGLKEAALTLQQGGGIGYDFSTIRPKGALVHGVGADASGPLSFMDVWDSMCRTIMSAGSRRGAMMATLRCDHPDIEAFILAKQEPGRLTNFNLSVLVTDAFMDAVRQDAAWDLTFDGMVYKSIQARTLWDQIMRATYDYAEPGVIFIDRINAENNLAYCETISATNPCGEQPLPPYGACLLGSINLATLVENPFSETAHIPEDELKELVQTAIRMMDNVVDTSRFPLEAQAQEALAKRRIGLGVTGLADALVMCGARYGGEDAVELTRRWMEALRNAAYATSVSLAEEKGAFPLFDADPYLERPQIKTLPAEIREGIKKHGIRNALLTSIAPTGTISLLADNVSSGVEPVFAWEYTRTVRQPDGSRTKETVSDYAYRLYKRIKGEDAPLTDAFVDAQSLAPEDHVRMQAVVQEYIDSSISKTINCPPDLPFDAFKDVYTQAYDSGCKGCTTYRPSDVRGAVLEVATPEPAKPETAPESIAVPPTEQNFNPQDLNPQDLDHDVVYMTQPLERPEALAGKTHKIKWPDSPHALYITVNDILQDGRRRPFEIFINSKNMEHYAWIVALTRMISAVFRRGGDVSFVAEELKAVFDPRGGMWMPPVPGVRNKPGNVPSLLAAIGEIIEAHMVEIGFLPPKASGEAARLATVDGEISPAPHHPVSVGQPLGRSCPSCGQRSLHRQEGCDTCTNCGYSKCA